MRRAATRPRRRFACAVAMILAAGAAADSGAQIGSLDGIPFAVGRGSFLATADGPATGLTLPAASAFVPDTRAILAAEVVGDRLAGGLILWQPRRFLVGYRHVARRLDGPSYNEDLYAVGISGRRARWVLASDAAWLVNDAAGEPDAFTFGASAGLRPHSAFFFALRALHLNRPHYVGGRLERIIAPGFAYRVLGARLVAAADLYFREDGSDDFAIRYGLESEIQPGLVAAAAVTNEGTFMAGLALRKERDQVGYGLAGRLDRGRRHHLIHIGHEENPPRSEPPRPTIRRRPPGPRDR